jgi:glutamate synthase domain-containing protein 3
LLSAIFWSASWHDLRLQRASNPDRQRAVRECVVGLKSGHITVRLRGSAGQSLGAFAVQGLKLEVFGDANDEGGNLATYAVDLLACVLARFGM